MYIIVYLFSRAVWDLLAKGRAEPVSSVWKAMSLGLKVSSKLPINYTARLHFKGPQNGCPGKVSARGVAITNFELAQWDKLSAPYSQERQTTQHHETTHCHETGLEALGAAERAAAAVAVKCEALKKSWYMFSFHWPWKSPLLMPEILTGQKRWGEKGIYIYV